MPPRFAVDQMPEAQFQFVIEAVIRGESDRAICAAYERQFGEKLAKSSLGRWRYASGEYLAECYRQLRFQANELMKNLDANKTDKFGFLMSTIEDRLLARVVEFSTQDPLKLIAIRQREGERRLRERTLELKEAEIELRSEEALPNPAPNLLAAAQLILSWVKAKKPEFFEPLREFLPDVTLELANSVHNQVMSLWGGAPQWSAMPHDEHKEGPLEDAGQADDEKTAPPPDADAI
jgi:hypothetical protein